jgi:hypothetical protein
MALCKAQFRLEQPSDHYEDDDNKGPIDQRGPTFTAAAWCSREKRRVCCLSVARTLKLNTKKPPPTVR